MFNKILNIVIAKMNRHERRKNKSKGIEDKVFYSSLAKAIDIHRSKNFIESEKLYKKLLFHILKIMN